MKPSRRLAGVFFHVLAENPVVGLFHACVKLRAVPPYDDGKLK